MFDLFIATPERQIYNGRARQVIIPSTSGVITVLPGHEPLISTIQVGELVVKDENDTSLFFAAFMGVVHVEKREEDGEYSSRVSILLERTENVEDLDEAHAEAALERARAANVEKDIDDGLDVNNLVIKELNRVKIARKHKARL